jgi:hypothetical protein
MQIGSGLSSFAPQQNATNSDSPQQIGRAGDAGGVAQSAERSHASVPTQDGAVTISPQGAAAAARERVAATSGAGGAADTGVRSLASGASGVSGGPGQSGGGAESNASARDASQASSGPTKSASPSAPKPSSAKSFAYGTLGLERPDKPQDTNKAYSAGRWLAACATVWGLLALILA